jgi:hypothetical protein
MPQLGGAIDIDISITPFTNTLAIRRLNLRRGQSEEIIAVYIRVPVSVLPPTGSAIRVWRQVDAIDTSR